MVVPVGGSFNFRAHPSKKKTHVHQCIISVGFFETGRKAQVLGEGNCGDIYINGNKTHFFLR